MPSPFRARLKPSAVLPPGALQLLGLSIVFYWQGIVTWLPTMAYGQ